MKIIIKTIIILIIASTARADFTPIQKRLDEVGTWDGATQSAALNGPYADSLQQQMPFGRRSFYLMPWRAYVDTQPASSLLDVIGVNYSADARTTEALAQVLAQAGVKSARLEVGWNQIHFDDPGKINGSDVLAAHLRAMKKYGLRPLILLNANSGMPGPARTLRIRLLEDAPAGARTIKVDNTRDIRLFYSGLRGQAYQVAFPRIVATDDATGVCRLSAPLAKNIKAGNLEIIEQKYQPFGGEVFADGSANPALAETLDGWRRYVTTITRFVRDIMSADDATDAGFDVEIWNEYTFGSQFLDEKNYYDPPRVFQKPLVRQYDGRECKGPENLLPMTIDILRDPQAKMPGVRIISGFSNQRPWDSGSQMWPGQTGFSRHYYTSLEPPLSQEKAAGLIAPESETSRSGPLNALGIADGKPDGKDWHTVVPGSFFVPTFRQSYPEFWLSGMKTETMIRDLQPFPNQMAGHFRFSHAGNGRHAEVWMTETNCWRLPFANWLIAQQKLSRDDLRLRALMHHMGAKATLRLLMMYGHKGLKTATLYTAKGDDLGLGVVSENFYKALADNQYVLTPRIADMAGPQLASLQRLTQLMRTGQSLAATRPLNVLNITEHKPRLVFRGDGTTEHPDRYHRDDLAILPYQLSESRYAIGMYVVTRDLTHTWNADRNPLDPARYDMPEQEFEITLGNIAGENANARLIDLMDGGEKMIRIEGDGKSATVRVPLTDAPRILVVDERQAGPLIINPRLKMRPDQSADLEFETNVAVSAEVTWGALPQRGGDGRITTAPSTRHTVRIAQLRPNTGVRVSAAYHELEIRWPRWDYDTQGVNWIASKKGSGESAVPSAVYIPELNHAGEIRFAGITLPDGLKWETAGNRQTLQITEKGQIVQVSLEKTQQNLVDLLPVLTSSDQYDIRIQDWCGAPSWLIEIRLDGTAHPDVTLTHQRYLVTRNGNELVCLAFKGTTEAVRIMRGKMDRIAAGARFSR